ncbi:MAG: RNA 2',3'-cyclic phosphodiesterase [Pyrinomonadaceae bacterium]
MKTEGVETWRVFCAIELPESARRHLLRHIARLKETVPRAKASWARDANLHLTLKFLGEIAKSFVADVSKAAALAVAGQRPFAIRLENTGAFPSHSQPRVLWIGVNDVSRKLAELHARLEQESAQAGFAKETRRFHPHLTIARLRQPENGRALATAHNQVEFEPVEIAVAELLVIRSELSSEGSKYTVVSRHALHQGPTGRH